MRVLLIAIASLMFASGSAFADGHGTLAKSGVINFHTGWICEYPTTPGSNDTAVGGVSCKGYTFSSDGSPALHEGVAGCYGAFDIKGDVVANTKKIIL